MSSLLLALLLWFSGRVAFGADVPSVTAGIHTVGVTAEGNALVALAPTPYWPDYGQGDLSAWVGLRAAAVGNSHTVGLLIDGTVIATGNNYFGECNVSNWTGIRSVAAAYRYTLGLDSNGTVRATGYNSIGQLNVGGWSNITAIAAGGGHNVGLKNDGTVVAVGTNNYGQCNVATWSNIVAIAAGGVHTLGLKSDGTVLAAGTNSSFGETNVAGFSNIVAIAAGSYHSLGLKADGTVIAVGANWRDQCAVSGWTNIIGLAAGSDHSVGLKADHTVIATGGNEFGQSNVWHWYLGNQSVAPIITLPPRSEVALLGGQVTFSVRAAGPGVLGYRWLRQGVPMYNGGLTQGVTTDHLRIANVQSRDVANYAVVVSNVFGATTSAVVRLSVTSPPVRRRPSIAAGAVHTLGLRADGTVLALGNNDYGSGQTNVGSWNNIVTIAAGTYHSVGVRAEGTVLATGWTNNHQADVTSWENVVDVSAGTAHTVGLKADGTVVGASDVLHAVRVSGWSNIVSVAAGEVSSLGLVNNGTVVASSNCDGNRFAYGACRASEMSNVVQLAVGYYHVVGLRADGTVMATGSNYFGACLVSNWNNIVAIAAGSFHTVGLRSNGTVVATGTNMQGECNVSGWSNIVAIAANEYRTVGLKADDTAVATGRNGNDVAVWYLGTNSIPPIITESPTNQTVFRLWTANLRATAAGPGNVAYQWRKDGENVPEGGRFSGTTSRTLVISRAQTNDSGDYTVVAFSQYGMTTSSVGRLEVILPSAISISGADMAPLDFNTPPAAGNWSWLSQYTTSLNTPAETDAKVQSLDIGMITNAMVPTSLAVPGNGQYAYWNSTAGNLQTKPGGVAFVAVLGTFQNDTGRAIDWLRLGYETHSTVGYEGALPGYRVYFSTSGESNSWQWVPPLSGVLTGALETIVNAASLPGERIYLLWVDNNTPSSSDPLHSIDQVILRPGVSLSIRRIGPDQFDLRWPIAVNGYVLHSRSALNSDALPVEEPDTPDQQFHHVIVTNTAMRFFHLQGP